MSLGTENGIAKLVLTNYIGAEVIEREDDCGRIQKGVFIPLDMNDLRVTHKGQVNSYMFVMKTALPQQFGWSHYMKLKTHPAFVQKLNDLGYNIPYMGNFKHQNYIVNKKAYQKAFVKVKRNEV